MMKLLRATIATLLVSATVALPVLLPSAVNAQSTQEQALCEGSGGRWEGGICVTPGQNRTVPGTIRQVVNILIFVVGAVAVLMVVIGGLRYTLSGGDDKATAAAKNTVLFAVVGIVIAVASYAIVNFVLDALNVN